MAYCLFLKGNSFDRDAWIEDVCQTIVDGSSESSHPLSQVGLQWANLRENLKEGEEWLHPMGGIRGVTVRQEMNGITLSIPVGNSSGDFGLAWELMRLGVKHGAEASGEGEDGILSLSAGETEMITRQVTAFHWSVLLSTVKDSGSSTLPVAGRIHLEVTSEDCAGGADALEKILVERMDRYSHAFAASLMSLNKDGVESLLSVYPQIPTLVDARTELIHLAGDNLPPEISEKIVPIKAELVYDLLGAERLGELIYLPVPSSEFILHALVVVATKEESAPDVPRPLVPPAGNEMSANDWATLAKAPCLVFLLVASCDGSIDKKEMAQFGKLLTNHAKMPAPIVRKILNITTNNVAGMFESLGEKNPAIELIEVGVLLHSGKLPAEDSKVIGAFLYKLGEEIASASGGFMGFGSKISKKEAEILDLLRTLLVV
ncbi:MAG: hypothetical protein V4689_04670 [Verrucomicrobiota bacterium]